ncbi:MAG TPA: hypothetical protein VEG38_21955 [Acidimicrobiia bacterium]|nr:hypothetical protein [Acidimicrobiia bacterium]
MLPDPVFKVISVGTTLSGLLTMLAGLWVVHTIRSKIFAAAMSLVSTALAKAGVSTRALSLAMTTLQLAQGVVTGLVGAFTLLSISMGKAQASAQAMIAELSKGVDTSNLAGMNELLDRQAEKIDEVVKRNKVYSGAFGWVRAAGGNIVGTLGGALGLAENKVAKLHEEEEGLRDEHEKNTIAAARMKDNIDAFAHAAGMTTAEVEELAKANNLDLTQGFNSTQTALGKAAGGMNEAEVAAAKLKGTLKEVGEEVAKQFTLASVWSSAQAAAQAQLQASADAAKEAAQTRYETAVEGLNKEEEAERDSLDRRKQARQQALEDEHDMIMAAIEDRYDAEQQALDDLERAEKQSLDQRHRDQDQALDRQHRSEQQALDARLRLLDQETDKRKREEERRYEAERDEVQWMIDNTFGAEREGWKARLVELEEGHEDRLDEIDNQAEAEKTAEKNGLDDRQQQEQNALDDRQKAEQNSFADRFRDLNNHLENRETAEKNAETTRYNNAGIALDNEFKQYATALDNKYKCLQQKLADIKKCEEDAADARYGSAEAKNKLAAQLYQTHLDDQLKKAEKFTQDLARVSARGGTDVMAAIAQLPADVVAEKLKLPADQFNAWLEDIRAMLALGKGVVGWLPLPKGIAGPPTPIRAGADGGILRFADGGEYHVAQLASAGDWRLWAEPETGGEAYIPLARSKRTRSTSILSQVANSFGYGLIPMAGGAGPGGAGGTGGITFNLSIDARVAAGVDADAVGRAIALHARRAVDEALDGVGRKVIMRGGTR